MEKPKSKEEVKWYNYIFVPGGIMATILLIRLFLWMYRQYF